MSNGLYIVFSSPPDGVSLEEYDRWHDDDARESVQIPGLKAVRRYAVTSDGPWEEYYRAYEGHDHKTDQTREFQDVRQAVNPLGGSEKPYSHLAVYEIEGSGDVKDIVLPDWFDRRRVSTWNCSALSDRIEPVR